MKPAEAKRWVKSNFGTERRFEVASKKHLPDTEFSDALEHLKYLPKSRTKDHRALELFLYSGCKKFNRWFVPSPPSVPAEYHTLHKRFAKALARCELVPMNAPVFLVHSLRDDVYDEFSGKRLPLGSPDLAVLHDLKEVLNKIVVPADPVKQKEVLEQHSEITSIINALANGTLKTRLKTFLPYPLTKRPLQVRLIWEGQDVLVSFSPQFSTPPQMMIQTGGLGAIRPLSTTRWQYGTTAVELEFSALIDPSLQVPALQLPAVEGPFDAWPNGLKVAFDIIYRACWALRGNPEYIGTWAPAPGDFGEIESVISMPDQLDLGHIRRGNPSLVFEMFTPSESGLCFDLGKAEELEWFERCRILADQYALFGEAREAIFWLNVGVEALLRSRMDAHIEQVDLAIDLDVLDGGTTYWDKAKQLVAAKNPKIAEEIEWPTGGKKPSMFQQIKYYCKNVPNSPAFNECKKHYGKVSARRNNLFHGSNNAPISIEDMRSALESFDWLLENFNRYD